MASLVEGLSPKGALHRALVPESWYWDTETELAAAMVEAVHLLDSHYVRVNYKDAKPRPLEIPRPWRRKKQRKGTTLAEFKQMMRGN